MTLINFTDAKAQVKGLFEIEGLFLIANYEEMYAELRKDTGHKDLKTPAIPQDILLIPCRLSDIDSLSVKEILKSCELAYLIYSQAARWTQKNLDSIFMNAKPVPIKYKGITGSPLNPFVGILTTGKLLKGRLFFDTSRNEHKYGSNDTNKYQLMVVFDDLEKEIVYLDNPFDFGYLKRIELYPF
jgi:hypothetical protein